MEGDKVKPIPEHWLNHRLKNVSEVGLWQNSVSPFHSCLNYLYACLESRVKRYCIAYRLDIDFPVLHSISRPTEAGLIYDLMEPLRPSVDRLLYRFMGQKKTLDVSDFFEIRQGVSKVMPELTSKIIPLVRSLDPDINRIVKEFASFFKTRLVQDHPDDDRKSRNANRKTQTKPELPSFPLPDEFTEAETLAMPEREWSAMS